MKGLYNEIDSILYMISRQMLIFYLYKNAAVLSCYFEKYVEMGFLLLLEQTSVQSCVYTNLG